MLKNEVEKVLRFLQQELGINHGHLLLRGWGEGAGDSHITRTGVLIVSLKVKKVGLIPFRVLTLKSTQREL